MVKYMSSLKKIKSIITSKKWIPSLLVVIGITIIIIVFTVPILKIRMTEVEYTKNQLNNNFEVQMITFEHENEVVNAVYSILHADNIGGYIPAEWDNLTIANRIASGQEMLLRDNNIKTLSNYICVAFYEPGIDIIEKDILREYFSDIKPYKIGNYKVAVLRIDKESL